MPTSVEREFNLRRIQRFIAKYALNHDLVARMVFSLLPPVKTRLVLSMNRTNGKFGIFDVNILMLDVTYNGIHIVASTGVCPIHFFFPVFLLIIVHEKTLSFCLHETVISKRNSIALIRDMKYILPMHLLRDILIVSWLEISST